MTVSEMVSVQQPQDFADWLAMHGAVAKEVWVVIYKKASGKQTTTYGQLVEVAICYGWIDVLERSVDQERYALRFMPRRRISRWTDGNRAIALRLIAEGRMTEAGRAVLPGEFRQTMGDG